MKSALLVIAQDVFRDEEYARPKAILEARGVDVTTASVRPGPATGKLGMNAEAQVSVKDAAQTSWDAVAFIGGAGASVFFDDESAHRLARDTLARGAVLGAICIAPTTLARAGLLTGLRATSFESQRDELISRGVTWTGEPVTVDGGIITANGPEAAAEFGERLAKHLGV
jgi:protease I